MDAFKQKMKANVESKVKLAKEAWESLEKELDSDGATNSQAGLDYENSVATPLDTFQTFQQTPNLTNRKGSVLTFQKTPSSQKNSKMTVTPFNKDKTPNSLM